MTPMSPQSIEDNYSKGGDIDGVIVYRPTTVQEVDKLTQVNVPLAKGSSTATFSDQCIAVSIKKTAVIADVTHPYRLHYEHGLLESYTFGATLTNDGILTSVNSVSTPDQGKTISNLASAASSAAAAAAPLKPTTKLNLPDCTVTPILDHFEAIKLPAVP
jgi:hypothetical protein